MQSAKLGTNKYIEWNKEKSSCNFLFTDQRSKTLRKNEKKCRNRQAKKSKADHCCPTKRMCEALRTIAIRALR
jgi:hypothetical protein